MGRTQKNDQSHPCGVPGHPIPLNVRAGGDLTDGFLQSPHLTAGKTEAVGRGFPRVTWWASSSLDKEHVRALFMTLFNAVCSPSTAVSRRTRPPRGSAFTETVHISDCSFLSKCQDGPSFDLPSQGEPQENGWQLCVPPWKSHIPGSKESV